MLCVKKEREIYEMLRFLAIKTHYDHRASLPHHLKYSRVPTKDEYDEYLSLFYDEGVGGEGFHECLNFNIQEDQNTKIYLPPGYVPDKKKGGDEFIVFTFTYKTDQEISSHIIGVHAGTQIINRDGIKRKDIQSVKDVESFFYHAESPADLTTLFSSPIKYNFKDGVYTPKYQFWGNGLRYITDDNAKTIIDKALEEASNLSPIDKIQSLAVDREIQVLETIRSKYFDTGGEKSKKIKPTKIGGSISHPDKEVGYIGEKYVYEKELGYVSQEGLDASSVEWISQAIPSSVFDIKTVRKSSDGYKEHYLEVKSTKMDDYNNVYISSNQIDFFSENPDDSTFVFVKLDRNKNVASCEDYTLQRLKETFSLKAIKYKIIEK